MAIILGGCLSRPSMTVQTYAFTTPLTTATNSAPADRVLCIRKLQISPPFDERSLVYRTGDFSYVRDPYAQFLGSPAEELMASISGILSADGSFGAIVGMGSDAKPDMLVEINISQLYGDIRKPGSPAAVLAMHVVFVKAPNDLPGQVIFQRSYYSRVPVETASAPAFMKGWNQGLSEILAKVASDFREHENE